MIVIRKKTFSIYSIETPNKIVIPCKTELVRLEKSSIEEVESILKLKNKIIPSQRILVYNVFVGDTKAGIIQLSENSLVEVELDWIPLAKNTDCYLNNIINYFLNLAISSNYRRFVLGLLNCSENIINNCLELGFLSSTIERYNNIIKLTKSI